MGEPGNELIDTKELLLGYLDYYRSVVEAKLNGLSEADLRKTRLPSGWTPLELLKHLVFMERRWLRWGFAGEPVDRPWGDSGDDPQGRWQVDPDEGLADLLGLLRAGAESTRALVAGAELSELGAIGGRFSADNRPTLSWILFHVLQEYTRHAGHLDIVRELADGSVGE
ncbi:MAG: hypothetical protein QOG10_6943 [Kribbellaceae bacterium]|jgi:uncharacterized damage-inducible protein DinB|nr:hypothetical protein [Kribbellaceae bacterium]